MLFAIIADGSDARLPEKARASLCALVVQISPCQAEIGAIERRLLAQHRENATIVGDAGVSARLVRPTCNVTAERGRAAALDGRHHLQLVEAQVQLASCQAEAGRGIRDLQTWVSHVGGASASAR
jgi:hypothetical protein